MFICSTLSKLQIRERKAWWQYEKSLLNNVSHEFKKASMSEWLTWDGFELCTSSSTKPHPSNPLLYNGAVEAIEILKESWLLCSGLSKVSWDIFGWDLILKVESTKGQCQHLCEALRISGPTPGWQNKSLHPGDLYTQQSLQSIGLGESKAALGMFSIVKTAALHLWILQILSEHSIMVIWYLR